MRTSHIMHAFAGCAVIFSLLLVLFADFLPTYAGSYADQRFFLVGLTGFVSIVATIYIATRGAPSKKTVFALLPALLFIFAFPVLSIPFREQLYVFVEPGLYSFYFATTILGGLVLVTLGGVNRYVEVFVSIAAVACFFYGAMSVNVYLFALVDGQADLSDLIPWGFVNIRYWSHVATWLLPILPLAVLIGPLRKYRLWRVIVATGAGLWWWIILLSTSRGSMIGIASGVLLATLFFGRQSWPWLKQFIVYFLIGGAIWFFLSVLVPSLFFGETELRSLHATSSGRMPLFIEAWQMSLQNFPFGMGPQSWLTHDLLAQEYLESRKFGHPHNMYLMWAAEYGWLLILLLMILALQLTLSFWRRRTTSLIEGKVDEVLILSGVASSLLGALVHAGVSAVFIAPGSMIVGLHVLVAFWALVAPKVFRPESRGYNARTPAKLALASSSAAVVAVLWWLWVGQVHTYYLDMKADEIYSQEHLKEWTTPRFWFHGNFPRREGPQAPSNSIGPDFAE
ncbi:MULTISPECIES: O-antigen ligase family protein [Marinobacter]|uniref:O-antigen ligase family protein n=1 Tax=Marinobacter TaxID=2742 RepID=UPI0012462776|nr:MULTISPECIES: O-antigen ligase family protein [Marinobacter]MBL3554943.1 O-antigen ligase family protein [Marinobacter sp. JB05H06]